VAHILHNLMEEAILDVVDDFMDKRNICACEQCRLDVVAIALNSLPPRYVATPKGVIYAKTDFLEIQKNIDVIGAILKAIELVKKNPHH
jgi:competence protein ComFB